MRDALLGFDSRGTAPTPLLMRRALGAAAGYYLAGDALGFGGR